MARDPETIAVVTKLLLEYGFFYNDYDPEILPIPWNEQVNKATTLLIIVISTWLIFFDPPQLFKIERKLRIGFYEELPLYPVTPGVKRAMQMVRTKLETAGHEVVSFVPPKADRVFDLSLKMLFADEGKFFLEAL